MRFAISALAGALLAAAQPAAADTIELLLRSAAIPDDSRSIPGMFVTVRDAAGNPKPGAQVTFSPGTCVGFDGHGAGEAVSATTQVDGSTNSPSFAFDGRARACVATAAAPGTNVARFTLTRYSSASVAIELLDPQSVDGELFNLAARITAGGVAIPGFGVSVNGATPGAPAVDGAPTTNDLGLIGINKQVGFASNPGFAYVGPMDIRVSFPFGQRVLNARQVPPAPPPPLAALAQSVSLFTGTVVPTTISLENTSPGCRLHDARFGELSSFGIPPPKNLPLLRTAISFVVSGCSYDGFVPGDPTTLGIRIANALSQPKGSSFYAYYPGEDGRPAWQQVATGVFGNGLIRINVRDNLVGDFDATRDAVRVIGAFSPPASFQDLWWTGGNENGWGLSLMQHGETKFAVLFAYDALGRPTWHVASAAPWDATRTTFSGPFYGPTGSPWYDYRPEAFRVNFELGTMSWTPNEDGSLAYTFAAEGAPPVTKRLVRQRFDPAEKSQRDVDDLWWGGLQQNGYGVAVHQQGASLFILWFTYNADGARTWFVVPAGRWDQDTWSGRIYRPRGSFFGSYDPSRFGVTDVGNFSIKFAGTRAYVEYFVEGREGTLDLTRQGF